MLFNSYIFWVFFAIVIVLYRLLPHRGQNRMLLAAGCVFYGWWDWRFLILLFCTTLVDYLVALGIEASSSPARRKACLIVSICANLGLLGFFKYYGFFSHELVNALAGVGVHLSLPVLQVVLPVGLSFYTFQEMAYTIDVYRGECKPARNFLDFALYVSFFPQLVAGPIERPTRLLPQVLAPRRVTAEDYADGLYLVLTGLFRKLVIADNMATIANTIFSTPTAQLTGSECLVGVYAFALQIYGDFSGYTAIAQGIARWLGFRLRDNFRMPYLAISPSDFWQRWHISLSSWLRDYLYIPLGGSRGTRWRTYRNLMLTMTLGGLWHGANWTFLAWGIYHGLLLCIWRPFEHRRDAAPGPWSPGRWIRMILMFHLVCFGWLLFRAQSMAQVFAMTRLICTDLRPTHFSIFALQLMAFLAAPFLIYEYWVDRKGDLLALGKAHWLPRGLVYSYLVLSIQIFLSETAHEFIYLQF